MKFSGHHAKIRQQSLSCAGGEPCFENAMEAMNCYSFVSFLSRTLQVLNSSPWT